ncbi:MAG: hypothetical protein WKG03_00070 [Telluria sp.]
MASKKQLAANDDAADVPGVLPANAPKGTDLMVEATTACDAVVAVTIDCPMMYELAGVELVDLQAALKKLNDSRFSITRPMDAAKTAVMNLFRSPVDMVEAKIKVLKAAMLTYEAEQKRKAAIKQQLLDKIANEQRAQLAAESARQAEEARKQSELAVTLMDAGDSAGVAAALTAAEAAQEMSCALQQTTAVVSAATAATNVPTVEGITTADVWKARVLDLPALLRFIADNPAYHDWIEIKMTGLNDMAKAQRDALRIPGVEAFEESRIAASRTTRKAA